MALSEKSGTDQEPLRIHWNRLGKVTVKPFLPKICKKHTKWYKIIKLSNNQNEGSGICSA